MYNASVADSEQVQRGISRPEEEETDKHHAYHVLFVIYLATREVQIVGIV
jgi:hypothetical protein